MASTAGSGDRASQAKPVDESLWWDSFVVLLEQLEDASTSPEISPSLVKKLKSNHAWLLDSLTRFKSQSAASRSALDSPEICLGQTSLRIKPELREAALHVSSFLCLDEVQSCILVNRSIQQGSLLSDYKQSEFLHSMSIQYYLERQCLLKCVRWIFMHALYMGNVSHESDDVREEALLLVHDGLEKKLFTMLRSLLFPEDFQKTEVDLLALWVEETLIESNLVLDILFLAYYENFCSCNRERWQNLCQLLKEIISGSFNIGKLAASSEAKNSFYHAKVQLLLILIETLNLENLLRMVHDDVPFRDDGIFLLKDIQEMDTLVSSLIPFEAEEVGPLILAWAVFLYLHLSLPGGHDYHVLMEIDHMGYVQNAFVPFAYLMEILHNDLLVDSDGPVSGYLSILKTFISAFIASFEIAHQSEILKMIIDILCKIYRGEESLCMQFWDRNSFVDKPIQSLLYSLENYFPVNTAELVRLLSALCEGSWPAECVFNFLCSMDCIASLYDIHGISNALRNNDIVETPYLLHVEGFDTIAIPSGAQGRVLKILDDNTALVQWKCGHSGVLVLLLRLAEFHSNSYEDVYLTLDLLYRMVSFNKGLCFALMAIDQRSLQSARLNGETQKNARIDLAKVICSLVIKLVYGGGIAELVSLSIDILVEMLKCLPSHVVEVTLRTNIFGISHDSPSSGLWLLSGGLAKVVLADREQTMELCSLTMSVLNFTIQLVEIGAGGDMVSSLVVFSLQYVLLNHENWNYKFRYARWKVTQKVPIKKLLQVLESFIGSLQYRVLEVMKSCIKAAQVSSKLSSLVGEILHCDSSIHNVLLRTFCIKAHMLEGLYVNRLCDLREIEGMQFSVCLALEVTFAILKDLLKDTSSGVPVFVQAVLSSTSKPIPVITATASLISFSRNTAIQVAAARVLSILCFISSRVQPYSSENAFSVLDDMQLKDLSSSIYGILVDEKTKSEDLLISVVNLLISAARFQPAFVVSLILSMGSMESPSNNAEDMKHQVVIAPAAASSDSRRTSPLNSIMRYVNKSKNLFERSPCLLLSILSLIKALWDGNAQYMQILEIFRSSEHFWKQLSSPINDMEDKCASPAKDVDDDQTLCSAYRYQCEAAILEIIAHDVFLHKNVLHDGMTEKQITEPNNQSKVIFSIEVPKGGKTFYSKDILTKWCESSTLVSRIKSYSSGSYPEKIIHRAKVEVVLCVVHMMVKISTGDAGSLSLSLVETIRTVSKKLTKQPTYLALLQQYSAHGYSEGHEAVVLVLIDLYYHILGELEGRVIAPGHFKEVLHYLLELDIFQHYEHKNDRDLWPPENEIYIFDITRLRSDLGIELWDHSNWETSKPVAERMISAMQHTNLVKLLAHSKNSALRALTCLLSVYAKNLDETQPTSFGEGMISEPLLRSGIEHLCQHLQTARASLLPAMSPSEDSLKFLATQVELLLNLSKILSISYQDSINAARLLPVSLLLIRTSDIALRLLSDARQSTILQRVVNFFLTLLLTSVEIICPMSADKLDSEVDIFAEASLLSLGLLPVLCKYAETSVHCNLSVAAIDLILKGFSTPNAWLPVLQNHFHLQLIIHKLQQHDRLSSVPIIFKFFLTLARTKGGAKMLHKANVFQSLKVLLSFFLKDEPYSSNIEGFSICNTMNEEEDANIWGLGLAISASMICSLVDDISCTELVGNAIHYFFSEKTSLMYYHISFPKFPSDDHSKKKARVQKSQTSLTALKETEYALMLTCILARHQDVWIREMKEMDSELRETIIHMLAFISKGTQRIGDSLNRIPPLLCPPVLKKEITAHRRPSFVESKHGWFTLAALGSVPQNKSSAISTSYLSEGTQKQENESADFHQTHFSDSVAIQIYRIAFLLLKFLSTQARVATNRAEEVGYIDLAHFPELPMPEILHGIQDQSITIVTEICQANRSREIQPVSQSLCLLLLQILEKSLYLELCISQSCGIRPVSGRVEDFSKEIKLLVQAVDEYLPFKTSLKSLKQIIALVHPGVLQTSSIL